MFLHQNGRKVMYKPTRSISGHVFYTQWVHIFGTPMAFFKFSGKFHVAPDM